MSYIPNSGSVVAFQGNPSVLQAVVAVTNFPTNPSVSGTVAVSNFPVTQNVSGSVVASGTVGASIIGAAPVNITYLSGNPNYELNMILTQADGNSNSDNGLITSALPYVFNGSTWDRQRGNSSIGTLVSTGESSVITVMQGSVGASVIGHAPVVIVGGSIAASFTPPANQSVSGTVGASIIGLTPIQVPGSVAVAIVSGSIAATFTPPANQSVSGAVSVSNFPTTQNVSGSVVAFGTVGASVIGLTPVSVSNFPTTQNVSGSVVASGTVGASIIGLTPIQIPGSVAVAIVSGSIAASFTPPANQSVSGTVGASIIGLTPIQVPGSVAVAIVSGSIAATFTPPANQSVSGTVGASIIGLTPVSQGGTWTASVFGNMSVIGTVPVTQSGTWIQSVVSSTPSSMLVGASIIGLTPVNVTNTNVNVSGSVVAFGFPTNQNVSGSVVAFVSGTPNVNTAGSVVAFQGTSPWVVQSIVGTYAEDAAHTNTDKGLFVMGVRNDTMASIVSADLDYTPHVLDSAGRTITKPFAAEDATIISYTGSVVSGSVTLIQASAIGKRSYITDFWVANTGNANTLVTFQGGDTSIVGYAPAPAGGGVSSPGIALPLKTTLSQDLAFKMGTATSILYLTVKGYQAP